MHVMQVKEFDIKQCENNKELYGTLIADESKKYFQTCQAFAVLTVLCMSFGLLLGVVELAKSLMKRREKFVAAAKILAMLALITSMCAVHCRSRGNVCVCCSACSCSRAISQMGS